MTIALPISPEPCAPYMQPTVVSLRNDVTSLTGGNRQRNARKGDHYRGGFNMPPLTHEEAMRWRSLMTSADTVSMIVPQPGFEPGPAGAPKVNGAGQLGTSLVIDGVTPNYAFRKGQMISILTAGRHWLYGIDATAVANGSGEVTLTLEVMIRTLHADNDPIQVGSPVIEGFAALDDGAWTMDENGFIRLAFEIEERG